MITASVNYCYILPFLFVLTVLHVSGEDNIVADALSLVQFSIALSAVPELKLYTFNPPGLVGLSR